MLAGPAGGSMVPAVCCVPLSVRRTSGPETLRSTAVCCVSSAVLPPVCWASSGGRSTSLGHVARGGVSVQAPPSASPPLLPSLVAPLPLPPLYFYSLNSAESSAFYSSDSPPTHTHVHTHVHTHTTHTHTYTYSYTQTSTYTHIYTHTCTHTHPCLEKHNLGVSGPEVPTALDQMHTQPL